MNKKFLTFALCIAALFSAFFFGGENKQKIENTVSAKARVSEIAICHRLPRIDEDKALEIMCKFLYKSSNEKYLVLVNKDNPLYGDYSFELVKLRRSTITVEAETCNALNELLRSAEKENHILWIASGYRSREKQQQLINDDVRRYKNAGMTEEEAVAATYTYTMPVGCSEHQTGLAVDILDAKNGIMEEIQENQEANKWLRKHCFEYGFILRYPKGKENITGIKYEPWHIRYVGKEAARFLYEKDLTLEEFTEYIRK